MTEEKIYLDKPRIVTLINSLSFMFFWLRWFYPKAKGIELAYLLYTFVPQKLLRINGKTKWPVHFTSRVQSTKNITVGNRCAPGLNSNCYIQGRSGISIGNNFRMGPGSGLISSNHDINNYDRWLSSNPIEIGNNVWLGMNVVVMPGVKIGDNVVVGANSVISKDIPSNSIAVGNPCKVIKEKPAYEGELYNL
jgi:acetyltransferase-like isoleucine patch superfamily enzyme